MLLSYQTISALYRYKYRVRGTSIGDKQNTPTVSVCVAARNETHALAQCLERILQSDYPKLEILVLDDSSSDDTSLIIKSFARAGVRFIAGNALPEGWLGKNHAYQTLIDESSGDYVLFMDVDTTISVATISKLVAEVEASNASMISVLPRREDSYRASAVFGTMRYYWELLLSSKSKPPASSAIWMAEKDALAQTGVGLSNYGMSVRPERHLARQLQRAGQYVYIIGTRRLGIGYEKRLHSQYETAVRLYYPMTGRNLMVWLVAGIYMMLLITPLPLLFFASNNPLVTLWSLVLVITIATTFSLFVRVSYSSAAWPLRTLFGPVLLLQEFVLLTFSYVLYKTKKITWKGRPVISQPVKHDALRVDE